MPAFQCFVPGTPRPQGSKRHVGGGRMVESSKYVKAWRHTITQTARHAHHGKPPLTGPHRLDLVLIMPARKHEKDHGGWHTVKPDLDKLIRAIDDAITTAGIITDDSTISAITALKRRAKKDEPPGAHITITPLGTPTPVGKQ